MLKEESLPSDFSNRIVTLPPVHCLLKRQLARPASPMFSFENNNEKQYGSSSQRDTKMCCIRIHLPPFLLVLKMMLCINKDVGHVMFPGVSQPISPLFRKTVGYESALHCLSKLQLSSRITCLERRLTVQWPQLSRNLIWLPMSYNSTLYLMRLHTGSAWQAPSPSSPGHLSC